MQKIDRRDPDYEPPKYSDEELNDMYIDHVEEEKKERKISAVDRDIKSTEEIF